MTKKGNVKWDGAKYKAVPNATCNGCAFFEQRSFNCGTVHCTETARRIPGTDYTHKVGVIFVKKEKSNATHP
jgi:hypothetical protein